MVSKILETILKKVKNQINQINFALKLPLVKAAYQSVWV